MRGGMGRRMRGGVGRRMRGSKGRIEGMEWGGG